MLGLSNDFVNVRSKSPLITLSIAEGDCNCRSHELTVLPALIGRGSGSDVLLRDPYVSYRHCVLIYSSGKVLLKDTGSTHGTVVNGKYVRECPLKVGDVIRLGRTTSLQVSAIADPTLFQQATWHISTKEQNTNPTKNSSGESTLALKLSVRTLLSSSRVVSVDKFPCVIGRHVSADLKLDDAFASSTHCFLNQIGNEVVVRDLESRNGTRLNGRLVQCDNLRVGDRMEVGASLLTVLEVERKAEASISANPVNKLVGAQRTPDTN